MPRQERTKSGTGIYHVMLRGINRQDIFEEPGIKNLSPRFPFLESGGKASVGIVAARVGRIDDGVNEI